MTKESDAFYINRAEIKLLLELLRKVPSLAEDLAVTETKRARTTRPDATGFRKRRKMNSSSPMNDDAYLKAEALRNELFTWIRLVCEQRNIEIGCGNNLIDASYWLSRNVIALAMTEGSENAYVGIRDAMKGCERIVDLPPEDDVRVNLEQLEQANKSVVTAGQVEKIAGKLGDMGKGLNRRRVRYLDNAKALKAVAVGDDGTSFYRLGDVLHAHLTRRNRKGA